MIWSRIVAWVIGPIGSKIAAAAGAVVAVLAFYGKARRDGRNAERVERQADELGRVRDAVNAGDRVDKQPDRLREPDKYLRD